MSDKIICTNCGKEFEADEAKETTNDGLICQECFEDDFETCEDCGEVHRRSDMIELHSGHYICQSCYEDDYFTCDECGDIRNTSDGEWLEREERFICLACLRHNYTRCDECGDWIPDAERIETAHADFICQSCYEDGYFTCDECGEVFPESDYGSDGCCERCAEENIGSNDSVHSYSYKPSPIFHRADTEQQDSRLLYMGIELELSHDSGIERNTNISECLEILNGSNDEERNVYLKEDGSLELGFEIVSHPRTLASWHTFRPTIENYFKAARQYTDGSRDGLHVHISRRGMKPAHMARLGAFIAACQDEIVIVARRNSAEWAKYHAKPNSGKSVKDTLGIQDRYTALNWRNDATAEFRIFKATLDATEFYAAIEFAHAAYRFTKCAIGLLEIIRGNPWEQFLAFLNSHRDRYGSLVQFLETEYSKGAEQYKAFISALTLHKRATKGKLK